MQTTDAINTRRSIRRFTDTPVPREVTTRLLQAAIAAPSAKNRQPWRFVVVEGTAKAAMLAAMKEGLDTWREKNGEIPGCRAMMASAVNSWRIMRAAPTIVFVLDADTAVDALPKIQADWMYHSANTQSLGAAIQNLLLAATDEGLGNLWICDIFFAYKELCTWLGTPHSLVAAVALGYAGEAPPARPRLPLEDVTEWRE